MNRIHTLGCKLGIGLVVALVALALPVQAADFAVYRGVTDIGNSTTATITEGVDYTLSGTATANNTFVRIVNTQRTGAGGNNNKSWHQSRLQMASIQSGDVTSSVTFERALANANWPTRISWEIIEYTGGSGGANEIIVRDVGVLTGTGTTLTTSAIGGIADDNDVVVFVTGNRHQLGGGATTAIERGMFTSEWLSGTQQAQFINGHSGDTVYVSYAIVEFVGANWKVQRVEQALSTTLHTQTITAVGALSRAFLHAQYRSSSLQSRQSMCEVWLSATDTVSFQQPTAASYCTAVAWVIENTDTGSGAMNVQHLNGTRAHVANVNPVTWTEGISAVSDVGTASIMGETSTTDNNSNNDPLSGINLRLSGVAQVELWRANQYGTDNYRFSVVVWPTTVAVGGDPDFAIVGDPVTLDYGWVATNATSNLVLVVTNSSADTAGDITNITFGTSHYDTNSISALPITVPFGTSTNITIRFAPGALGTLGDTVTIQTDQPLDLTASLTGVGAEIVPTFAQPADYGFGTIGLGAATPHTFAITNTGAPNLVISSVSLTGTDAARFSESSGAGTVAAGGTTNITVTYLADVIGVHTANLEIVSNNGGTAPFTNTIQVTGEVVLPDLTATSGTLYINTDSGIISNGVGGTLGTAVIANNTATWTFNDVLISNSLTAVVLQGSNAVKIVATGGAGGNGDITIQKDLALDGNVGTASGSGAARAFGSGAGGPDNGTSGGDGEGGKDNTYTQDRAYGAGLRPTSANYRGGSGGAFGGDGGMGAQASPNLAGGIAYGRLDLANLGTAGGPVGGSGGGGSRDGGGGSGGGAVQMFAVNNITVASGVTISATGGNGRDNGGSSRNAGAAGAGGSGGAIRLVADSDLNGAGILTLAGATYNVTGGDGAERGGGGGGGRIVVRGIAGSSGTSSVAGGICPGEGTDGGAGSVLIDMLGGALTLSIGDTNAPAAAANVYSNYTSLSVSSNATLELGGTGTVVSVTISNDVTILGTLAMDVNGGGAGSADKLTVTGALDISSATLTLNDVGSDGDTYTIATYASLTGTFASTNGLPAGYAVNYGATSITLTFSTTSVIGTDPTAYDFGLIDSTTQSNVLVTITNSGDGSFTISSVTTTGVDAANFVLVSGPGTMTVGAGLSTTMTIGYKPTAKGTHYDAQFVINSDADNTNALAIEVDGYTDQLLAYQPFDITAGTSLSGTATANDGAGFGFTGNWTDSGNGSYSVLANSISWSDGLGNGLLTAGNQAGTNTAAHNYGNSVQLDLNADWAPYLNGGKIEKGGTLWFSYLAEDTVSPGCNGQLGGLGQGLDAVAHQAGEVSSRSHNAVNGHLLYFDRLGAGGTDTGLDTITVQPYFYLIRLDLTSTPGGDKAWMWVDAPLNSEPSTNDATAKVLAGDISVEDLSFIALGDSEVEFDEFRVGTTWADVIAIGTGTVAIASDNPTNFGSVATGTTAQAYVTITNSGSFALGVTNFVMGGTDPGLFTVTNNLAVTPVEVPAGGTAQIGISYSPVALGGHSAVITLQCINSTIASTNLNVQGTGIEPGNLVVVTPTLALGPIPQSYSDTGYVVVSNSGAADVTITNLTLSGTDTNLFTTDSAPIVVGAGATTNITVTYSPTNAGSHGVATLNIYHDGANASPQTSDLTGTALPAINITTFQPMTDADRAPAAVKTTNDVDGLVSITGTSMTNGAEFVARRGNAYINTWTISVTNATIDTDGVNNDTISLTMQMVSDYEGGVLGNTDLRSSLNIAGDAFWVIGPNDVSRVTPAGYGSVPTNELVVMVPGAVSYTLSGSGAGTGSFLGFTEAQCNTLILGPADVSGTKISLSTTLTSLEGLPGLLVAGDARFRLTNVGFALSTNAPTATIGIDLPQQKAKPGSTSAELGATIYAGTIASYGVVIIDGGVTNPPVVAGGSLTLTNGVWFGVEATGLSPITEYSYRGWASNASEGVVYTEDAYTFTTAPAPASNIVISAVTHESMDVAWDVPAYANGSLVLLMQGSAVTGTPTDDVGYGGNATYNNDNSSFRIADAQVVYSGTNSSVSLNGMADGVDYHLSVFSYVTNGADITYADVGAISNQTMNGGITWSNRVNLTGAESDIYTNGTMVQAVNFNAEGEDATVAGVLFTGDDSARPGWQAPDSYSLNAGTNLPFATLDYERLVDSPMFTENLNPVLQLSNLVSGELYRVQLFHAATNDGSLAAAHLGTGATNAESFNPSYYMLGEFTAEGTTARIAMTMTDPLQSGVPVSAYQVRNTNQPVTTVTALLDPVSSTSESSSLLGATVTAVGTITAVGTGTYEPGGSTNILSVSTNLVNTTALFSHYHGGLAAGTLYNYRAFASNATAVTWSTQEVTFLTEPVQASSLSLYNEANHEFQISWTDDATADGVLIVIGEGSVVGNTPADNASYAGDVNFGAGDPLGIGYVVYSGATGGSPITVTNLSLGTTYHVSLYAYAAEGGKTNYNQSPTVSASVKTTGGPDGSQFNPTAYTSLGTLNLSSGTLHFQTDPTDPTVWTNGVVMGTGVVATVESGDVSMALYNFDDVNIGASVTVTVTGDLGLVVSSLGDIVVAADILDLAGGDGVQGDLPNNGSGVDDNGGRGAPGAEGGTRLVDTDSAPPGPYAGNGGPYDDGATQNQAKGYGAAQHSSQWRSGSGGGYGGAGGDGSIDVVGGVTYGDMMVADLLGGSGGATGWRNGSTLRTGSGGGGGGAIELTAISSITLSGTIDASGGDGGSSVYGSPSFGGGGGSGGAILLTAPTVALAGSTLTVSGGNAGTANTDGGGGGGGRIAIYADTLTTGTTSVGGGMGLTSGGDGSLFIDEPDGILYLGGNGTGYNSVSNYTSLTVVNDAALAPGGAGTVATLNVDNIVAAVVSIDGTLKVDVDGTGVTADLLSVTNDVTLMSGAVLDVNEVTTLPYGQEITVVYHGGTLSGRFGTVTDNGVDNQRFDVLYETNEIKLRRLPHATLFIVK